MNLSHCHGQAQGGIGRVPAPMSAGLHGLKLPARWVGCLDQGAGVSEASKRYQRYHGVGASASDKSRRSPNAAWRSTVVTFAPVGQADLDSVIAE
ncbi:hypothetical protein PWT90_01646 [Aphanocladium album]|nr:hypothetical protein PWT90_01646 [Aphanocladium album]